MRIYLDSAPVIYAIEQVEGFAAPVDQRLGRPEVVLVDSDLTRLECRIKPLRENDIELLKEYDEFFASAVAEIVVLSRHVMDRAAQIRARFGFRTPDAIHLAAATAANCDLFLSNDHRLNNYPEIKVETIS